MRYALVYANKNRSSGIYQVLFYSMLGKLHGNQKKHKFRFKKPLYSIDASTIDLCLNLFPMAHFRKQKAGIRMHVKLDHSRYIPSVVSVTDAKVHENKVIKSMSFKKETSWFFDRGCTVYSQFSKHCKEGIYFVTRIKKNAGYVVVKKNDVRSTRSSISTR